MITKSQAKRKQDIKTKLMAAIAMLLVSSIMMVSSTYAWFTLSTAPEVTGINTAVGANGNLEMALVTSDDLGTITSGQGDSAQDWTIKNKTWGNLVDLSDESYGLNQIELYPSALNVATWKEESLKLNPKTIATAMLKTPTYGADGRVSELLANTTTSTYDTATKGFSNNAEHAAGKGVRAVGAASGMTDRQLAYRNYRSAASTAMVQAQRKASDSLQTNGQGLANIAIKHAMNSAATHTQEEVLILKAIVVDLLGDGANNTGSLQYIEKAYINYIIAYAASNAMVGTMNDDAFETFSTALEKAATLEEAKTLINTAGINTDNIPGVSKLLGTITSVKKAATEIDALTKNGDGSPRGDDITWKEINDVMKYLVDPEKMTINNKFPAFEAKQHLDDLIQALTDGITLNVKPESGVYADIADHCGDYKATVTLRNLEYNGITISEKIATMATETKTNPTYLDAYAAVVVGAKAPESGEGSQSMPISETYGYVIDLAFRTNAAASELLLQTAPKDRIYNGEGNAEVMGHGSTMTFESQNAQFGAEQVKNLMKAIRIVFLQEGNVLATAKLDMSAATDTQGGTGATAPIKLYTVTAGGTTYQPITEGQTGTHISDGADGFRPITGSETGTHVEVTTKQTDTFTDDQANAKIIDLTQNQATAISVLVYLDGEYITNKDVAISGKSAVGTMNLQFSSSAQLDPMDYTPLMEQSEGTGNTQATQYDVTLTGATGNANATAGTDYTFTPAAGNTNVTVTIGGQAYTGFTESNGTYTIPGSAINGAIVINATAPTGG